jgi:hypothetical protein
VPHLRPFNIGDDAELDLSQVYQIPENEAPKAKVGLRAGDVLFNNTNSADLVGKTAYISRDCGAGFSRSIPPTRTSKLATFVCIGGSGATIRSMFILCTSIAAIIHRRELPDEAALISAMLERK